MTVICQTTNGHWSQQMVRVL